MDNTSICELALRSPPNDSLHREENAPLLLLLVTSVLHAQDLHQRAAQLMDGYARRGFSGSVLVARGSTVEFEAAYGMANIELGVRNTVTTKFRIGSLTKQFTAVCVLLMEERGLLHLGDPLEKYLPDSPQAWKAITIYNLLTHTSGIPDYVDFEGNDEAQLKPWNSTGLINTLRDKPLEFTPGTKEEYSSSNYVVLGYLVEKLNGKSYADFVSGNLLKPLGMTNSGYDSHSRIIPNRAAGYTAGSLFDWDTANSVGALFNAGYLNMDWAFAAGALYSTVEDLWRWEQGLFRGKLLSPGSIRKFTTPFLNNYACGVNVRQVNGRRVINHNGGINGFSAHLAYYPDEDLTIVVLSNVRARTVAPIASAVAELALQE